MELISSSSGLSGLFLGFLHAFPFLALFSFLFTSTPGLLSSTSLYSIFHPCTSPLFLTTFSFINSHISPFCTLSLHCCRCLLILIHRHIFFSTHKLLGQLYTFSPLFFFFSNTTYRSLESLPHGFGLISSLFLLSIMIFFEFPSPTPPHLNLMAPDRLLIPSSSSLSSLPSQPIFGNPGCLEWIAIGPLFLFLIFVLHTYFSIRFVPFIT